MGGGGVSALLLGAYTTTLLVMVDTVKGGGRTLPTNTRLGRIYHHDGIYARKWPLPVYLYSLVGAQNQQLGFSEPRPPPPNPDWSEFTIMMECML
jgi:hypothetical protein